MTSRNRYQRWPNCIGIAAGAFLGIAGCSANKPAEQPVAASARTQAVAPSSTSKALGGSAAQSSSLDQLRQGKAIGTDQSSPLKDIYFDFDRYDLKPGARETLQADAEWLKKNPSTSVQIEGHCDERGTAEYNIALAAKRAQAAKDYLTTLGIDTGRLSTISYGQELPVCTEHNEDCWQKNRHDRLVGKSAPTS
jgi:peptidoglycan-associated lipoprotein